MITGSHNLGHKASFNNDENLVIIRGNRRSPRPTPRTCWTSTTTSRGASIQNNPKMKGDGLLKKKPDAWQDKYFNADGTIRVAQLRFWLSAGT